MCWNDLHSKWFFFVGIPMLGVWVIGMPLLALIILFTNRNNLDDEDFFSKYRMLYQGLKRQHYYWELVNLFRKISIVSINVFLALYPDYIKAIYAMMILFVIFKIQESLLPYEIPVFNVIEQREQIASVITFYGGLYFVKADISPIVKYLIISLVFLANFWFLILWSYVCLKQFKYTIAKKVAKLLRKIICMRVTK